LLEDLRDKQKQEVKIQEDLEELKESLRSDKQSLAKVTCDRDRLRSRCDEKDKALQVSMINIVESAFTSLS
jgi:hypothetical protein